MVKILTKDLQIKKNTIVNVILKFYLASFNKFKNLYLTIYRASSYYFKALKALNFL